MTRSRHSNASEPLQKQRCQPHYFQAVSKYRFALVAKFSSFYACPCIVLNRSRNMHSSGSLKRLAVVGLVAFLLAGCASSYDRRANNSMIGAGVGAAGGAVLSNGDPAYAIGGAVAGGLLGHILTPDRSYRSRHYYQRHRSYKRPPRYRNRGWQRGHHKRSHPRRHHRRR